MSRYEWMPPEKNEPKIGYDRMDAEKDNSITLHELLSGKTGGSPQACKEILCQGRFDHAKDGVDFRRDGGFEGAGTAGGIAVCDRRLIVDTLPLLSPLVFH